jgi:hypothetical protein
LRKPYAAGATLSDLAIEPVAATDDVAFVHVAAKF